MLQWTLAYMFDSIFNFGSTRRSGIVGSYSNSLTFSRTAKLFSTIAIPFYVPIGNVWGFLPISPRPQQYLSFSICVCWFLNNSHPGRCSVALWILICISQITNDVKHFCMCCWPSVYLLWREICWSPLPVFHMGHLSFCSWTEEFLTYSGY